MAMVLVGKVSVNHASGTLVQMKLKTMSRTSAGFSEKDIKSTTKLNSTFLRVFHELA